MFVISLDVGMRIVGPFHSSNDAGRWLKDHGYDHIADDKWMPSDTSNEDVAFVVPLENP